MIESNGTRFAQRTGNTQSARALRLLFLKVVAWRGPNFLARGSALLVALLLASPIGILAGPEGGGSSPTPEGFNKYLVYLGEATLAPGESSTLTDTASVQNFQEVVMQRDSAGVAANKASARQFFLTRFGLDFTSAASADPYAVETIPGAMLLGFVENPKANYRAYTISGTSVPDEGWEVRDGGWLAMVTQDTVLHGEYGGQQGKLVRAGTAFVFGNYNIKMTHGEGAGHGQQGKEIIINYQSGAPLLANDDGILVFSCDLSHPQWGSGKARGVVEGKTIRNVLTFPAELP